MDPIYSIPTSDDKAVEVYGDRDGFWITSPYTGHLLGNIGGGGWQFAEHAVSVAQRVATNYERQLAEVLADIKFD